MTEETVVAVREYGRCLGIAFQIADDLLDVLGKEDETGKSLGSDFQKEKLTLPLIRLLKQATPQDALEIRRLLADPNEQTRSQLRNFVENSDAIEYAFARQRICPDRPQQLSGLPVLRVSVCWKNLANLRHNELVRRHGFENLTTRGEFEARNQKSETNSKSKFSNVQNGDGWPRLHRNRGAAGTRGCNFPVPCFSELQITFTRQLPPLAGCACPDCCAIAATRPCLGHLTFCHWYLFRISCFGFRIFINSFYRCNINLPQPLLEHALSGQHGGSGVRLRDPQPAASLPPDRSVRGRILRCG